MARVEALLRRAGGPEQELRFPGGRLDLKHRKAFRAGREVELSRKEADILFYLARHAGRAVPREELLEAVWGYSPSSAARTVDFHVLNLRKKLEADPEQPAWLVTRHGKGFECVVT